MNSPYLENKKNFFLVYSVFFVFICLFILLPFFLNNKSIVFNFDGLEQIYVSFLYLGKYLRSIIFNFFSSGKIIIPLWDHSLGYGADIISVLNHHILGDPLNLLSIFAPPKYSEFAYNLLIIARFYLSGAAFAFYCFQIKRGAIETLFGSLAYAFCGYNLISMLLPPFLVPMITIPLLFAGIERIIQKEKPALFLISVFIASISNIYLFYGQSLLVLFYILIRVFFFDFHSKSDFANKISTSQASLKNFPDKLKKIISFAPYYIIGFLMSGIITIPSWTALLSSRRLVAKYQTPLFYDFDYYINGFLSLTVGIVNFTYDYWYQLRTGYAVLFIFAVAMIFAVKKQPSIVLAQNSKLAGDRLNIDSGDLTALKAAFIFFTLGLVFPIFGKFFNGFFYATNRWIFAYAFLSSLFIVFALPRLIQINKRELKSIAALSSVFIAFFLYLAIRGAHIPKSIMFIIPSFILIGLCLLFFIYKKRPKPSIAVLALFIFMTANIIYNGYILYSPSGIKYSLWYVDRGKPYIFFTQNSQNSVKELDDKTFNRFEENPFDERVFENGAMVFGLQGTSYYFSINNPAISDFYAEIEHTAERDFRYTGLDGRAMIGALSNVKYFVAAQGKEHYIPYGYRKIHSYKAYNGALYNVYENENFLPFGYTYSHYIPRYIYENFTTLQKQQTMMQAIVLNENLYSDFKVLTKPHFREGFIRYEASGGRGLDIDKNLTRQGGGQYLLNLYEYNSALLLKVQTPPNSETYIRFGNFKYLSKEILNYVYVISDFSYKSFPTLTPQSPWNPNKKNYSLNLGYNENSLTSIGISFNLPGVYSFDTIEVFSLPLGHDFEKEIALLKENVLEDVKIETNKVSGRITLKENKILALTIPYSKGWTAFVNGQKTKLLKGNTMYMALPLKSGDYEIVLRYRTPGIILGMIFSVIGFVLFALVFWKKRRCHARENGHPF